MNWVLKDGKEPARRKAGTVLGAKETVRAVALKWESGVFFKENGAQCGRRSVARGRRGWGESSQDWRW